MHSAPKRFLVFVYAEGRQTPKEIIQIISEFLTIFSTALCDRHQFYSFILLRVHPLLLFKDTMPLEFGNSLYSRVC